MFVFIPILLVIFINLTTGSVKMLVIKNFFFCKGIMAETFCCRFACVNFRVKVVVGVVAVVRRVRRVRRNLCIIFTLFMTV